MIYIVNNANNRITIDSWLNYEPAQITLYLNDIELGTFDNLSTSKTYIVVEIPTELLTLKKLQNMDYKLKVYDDNFSLFKIELVSVIKENEFNLIEYQVQNKLIQNEKNY
jgi:hypothetical protein